MKFAREGGLEVYDYYSVTKALVTNTESDGLSFKTLSVIEIIGGKVVKSLSEAA
jgi:hypothetical protein